MVDLVKYRVHSKVPVHITWLHRVLTSTGTCDFTFITWNLSAYLFPRIKRLREACVAAYMDDWISNRIFWNQSQPNSLQYRWGHVNTMVHADGLFCSLGIPIFRYWSSASNKKNRCFCGWFFKQQPWLVVMETTRGSAEWMDEIPSN